MLFRNAALLTSLAILAQAGQTGPQSPQALLEHMRFLKQNVQEPPAGASKPHFTLLKKHTQALDPTAAQDPPQDNSGLPRVTLSEEQAIMTGLQRTYHAYQTTKIQLDQYTRDHHRVKDLPSNVQRAISKLTELGHRVEGFHTGLAERRIEPHLQKDFIGKYREVYQGWTTQAEKLSDLVIKHLHQGPSSDENHKSRFSILGHRRSSAQQASVSA